MIMLLAEWLKNKTLVKAARQIFESDTFRQMREVLEAESPLRQSLPSLGPTSDDRSHRLGMIEGYQLCLNNLRQLAVMPPPLPKPLESTFENPDKE